MFKLAVLLFISCCSAISIAGEGFFDLRDNTPGFIASSWDSVVLLVRKDRYIGSAFVIAKVEKPSGDELYLITNNHVISGECKVKLPCSEIKILQNPPQLPEKEVVGSAGDIQFNSLVILKTSIDPDLALIKVTLKKSDVTSLLPLKISDHCPLKEGQRTYLIGFPATEKRLNEARMPISDQDLLLKRWSEGIFVKYVLGKGIKNLSTESALITTDALNGNSGGPLLNSDGEVIGVLEAARLRPVVGYPYMGREKTDWLSWHSSAVSCEQLKVFLDSKFSR